MIRAAVLRDGGVLSECQTRVVRGGFPVSSIHPRRNAGRGYAETSPVPVVIVCMLFVRSGVLSECQTRVVRGGFPVSSIHPRRNAGRGYAETSPVPVVIVCMLFVLS